MLARPTDFDSAADLGGFSSLGECLEASYRKHGDLPAATCMGRSISYKDWLQYSEHVASYLHNECGVGKGDRVAIMLPNSLHFMVSMLAIQKLGATLVATNPLYTPREMEHQLRDSGAETVIILDVLMDKLEKIKDKTSVKTVISASLGDLLGFPKGLIVHGLLKLTGKIPTTQLSTISFKEALNYTSKPAPKTPKLNLNDPAVLQYTGGTTGLSKGATLTQGNMLAQLNQCSRAIGEVPEYGKETVLSAMPLYHIYPLMFLMIMSTRYAAHQVLVPKPVPIGNTIKIIKKYQPTIFPGINTLFNYLNTSEEFKALKPQHFKIVSAAGMGLQEKVLKDWYDITGNTIVQLYGLSETSPMTHCTPLWLSPKPGSIGFPVADTKAKIVDDQGNEVAQGESGELLVQGPQVMQGYWNCPDETANCIKDGWFATGDIAMQDEDGVFYIVDRKKDMILVSGFNVYPNEIEEVLKKHPKVLEAGSIGVKDDRSGEAVKAFVVKSDESLTVEELKQFSQENLTGYKRPKHYQFIEELPKSNVGKVLRRKLVDIEKQV